MAYYSDVSYIAQFSPEVVRANAAEFRRVNDLIDTALPQLDNADDMAWEGSARGAYSARLAEARQLMSEIGTAFRTGGEVLDGYATSVETAKELLTRGRQTETQIADVLRASLPPVPAIIAGNAEPMRGWEAVRDNPLVNSLSEEQHARAQSLYDQANHLYNQARELADRERDNTARRLATVREGLPRYEVGGVLSAADVRGLLPGITEETEQARANPLTRAAPVPAGGAPISPELAEVRTNAAPFPDVQVPWIASDPTHPERQAVSDAFIRVHADTIRAAARHYGVSPEAVATILRHEVTGTPQWLNEATEFYRRATPGDDLPGDRDPDTTSYGAGQIQIRRAAEVLGYDPDALTDAQRGEIKNSLNNAEDNIFITAGHLAQLQDQSAFAGRPASLLSDQDYEELFRLYNDGPGGEPSAAAREYAMERAGEREHARRLLEGS